MQLSFLGYILSLFKIEALLEKIRCDKENYLNIPKGSIPFILSKLSKEYNCFYISKNEIEAEEIFEGVKAVGQEVYFFPEVDVIPYSSAFPSADKLSDRMTAMYFLQNKKGIVVVTTVEAFLRKLPPVEFFKKSILRVNKGQNLEREEIIRKLVEYGYIRDFKTTEQGNFSVRGDIVDVFLPTMSCGIRINFLGNTIEAIKEYNPASQISYKEVEGFELVPANEFSIEKEKDFTQTDRVIHSDFVNYYSNLSSLLDYSSTATLVMFDENILSQADNVRITHEQLMEKGRISLFWNFGDLLTNNEDLRKVIVKRGAENEFSFRLNDPPEFGEGFSRFITDVEEFYIKNGYRVFILVEYEDLARRFMEILKKFKPRMIDKNESINGYNFNIVLFNLEHGFEYVSENEKVLLLTESDISGKKRIFRKRIRQIDTIFEDIEEIQEGEYVVHLNYGIGVFKGVERINVLGKEKDYILLKYADDEKLYVPLEQSNLIGKYIGALDKKPALDSLGGKSWAKKKNKAEKSIREFAQKLVSIYAKRKELKGIAFLPDTEWQKDFENRFEYIETPDQVKVIEEIKRDMEKNIPMDRLLCGDVGFGKTEVAMRAAFKAVLSGKQVAVVAPTTILVEQHYLTFIDRFKGFPVKIEMVSRYTDNKHFKSIVNGLKNHSIDIIIGTHKLFSKEILFHSPGLVIIDEEHKFGVGQKETLKERYPMVDFLSLSATPIPRTLNMALSSLRDISLLETPPDIRIPVETYVGDFSMELVKYAINGELNRKGQIFFVHNTIKRLPEYAFAIKQLVPEARVAIAHGQIGEEELEKAFIGFVKREYDVLVSTTIIDSGLDITNANTIIVSDAHRYGLSQLYQLKGRVGRGKLQGYAYFLYPPQKALNEKAQKRLFVINEYTNLGAGFNIALKDLEIRGAGNILGREQHGNIVALGYDVYTRLLREEVEKLKGTYREEVETMIDLNYNAYIPDEYISESTVKMEVYKKILSVKNEEEIKNILKELFDRFGSVPSEIEALFEISRLKIKASSIGVESIIEKDRYIEITFSKYSKVDVIKVMNLKSSGKHEIEIRPNLKNKIFYRGFESNIVIKVKRLISFLDDITIRG